MAFRGLTNALFGVIVLGVCALRTPAATGPPATITITSPIDGAVFPRDFAPPVFRWKDESAASRWRVNVDVEGERSVATAECAISEWHPSQEHWEKIKALSVGRRASLVVTGMGPGDGEGAIVSSARVSFQTSPDPVGSPIFYREVPLPVGFAIDNKPLITWKVGDVSSSEPPRTVLSGMRTCANCHSFSADGKTLAMDIDFSADKGAYAIAEIGRDVTINPAQLMTWNDFRREDGQITLGLQSSLSPDGRHVVSTVKETIVLSFMPDPYCSQLFFPIRGILVVYDRASRSFRPLGGGDDPAFVQTNPTFSPDGRWLVFARAQVPEVPETGLAIEGGLSPQIVNAYADGRRKILYDLYRVPFNDGRGGPAEPLPGASGNGKRNFFARYSPDGRWIVFCQAGSMMLNRPDSGLYIMPAGGGTPRRLRCNAPSRMNSWHSFSPNGLWLVFASKANGPMTQLWLTHIDRNGDDTPPVMLEGFVAPDRAANIPEFVNLSPGQLQAIVIAKEIRDSAPKAPRASR
jgi:hypothetical protein